MKNSFENSLPVGLVMSLYDFDISTDNKNAISSILWSDKVAVLTNTELHDDTDFQEHVWINGELSWKL